MIPESKLERAFSSPRNVQRFQNTIPAQVRLNTYTMQHEGIGELLKEMKKHCKSYNNDESKITKPNNNNNSQLLNKRQLRNEQIIEYERKKNELIDNKLFGDTYNTIFVSRIPIETTETELKELFNYYGIVLNVTLIKRFVHKKKIQRLGYAFIEFKDRNDAKKVIATGNTIGGSKMFVLHGRRLVLDVERGRVVKNWLPLRLRR
jgi:U1 small nuclear ribonucleoprotein